MRLVSSTIRLVFGLLPGCTVLAVAPLRAEPAATGQLGNHVEWIAGSHAPASDPQREFAAQRGRDACLVLTAISGFFNGGIRAAGSREPKDSGGAVFIDPEFGWLELGAKPGLTQRWHFWVERSRAVAAGFHLTAGENHAGVTTAITLDGITDNLSTRALSDPERTQGEALPFTVGKSGCYTFTLILTGLTAGTKHYSQLLIEGLRVL